MKKTLFVLCLLILIFALPVFAWNTGIIGGGVDAEESECTQVIDQDSTNNNEGEWIGGADTTVGQSFELASGGDLCEVQFLLGTVYGSPNALTLRVGTTSNLSSSYLAQADATVTSFTSQTWITFTFTSGPALSSSTTYYLVLYAVNDWGDRIHIATHTTASTYADGEGCYGTAYNCNNNEGDDLGFRVSTE